MEALTRARSDPTAKLRLALIRRLFAWLAVGQVVPVNPATAVRGPAHSVRRGKTPVLEAAEARQLLDSIEPSTQADLRDRALIALMVFSFARVGAALGMKVEDIYVQGRRLWLRLNEKGGKRHEMPCHHQLEAAVEGYLDGCGLKGDPKGPLFRTLGRGTGRLTGHPTAPGQRLRHDPPACSCGRHRNRDRQLYLPSHRHHRLPGKRRRAGDSRGHGQPCLHPHHAALRPAIRPGQSGGD